MDISSLKLYATHEHPCSYLEDKRARTAFVDPSIEINSEIYSDLTDYGFRRSGAHVYRPHCKSCKACIPIRIATRDFRSSRSQRRCLKRNSDIEIRSVKSIQTDEHYQLYQRYITERHSDGDMYPPNREQFSEFLTSAWGVTDYLEFRLDDQLLGVAVTDRLQQGISAIYTYFEPNVPERSLGVFGVLSQITLAKELDLPFVYLGYWIRDCQKMSYKTQYRPLQMLINNHWYTFA